MSKNWAKISKIVQNWQYDATIFMKLKHFKSCLWFFVFFKFKLLERTAENCECTTVKRKRPSKLRKLSKTEQICSKLTKQSNNFCETEAFQIMFVIFCIFQIYTIYYVGCDKCHDILQWIKSWSMILYVEPIETDFFDQLFNNLMFSGTLKKWVGETSHETSL